MAIYARLYVDGVQEGSDIELPALGDTTGINAAQIRCRTKRVPVAIDQYAELHQDWFYLDSGLIFPGDNLFGTVIGENWDNMSDWNNDDGGSGYSEISPTGQLHQLTYFDGDTAELNKSVSSLNTSYTWEFKHIVNQKQEWPTMWNYINLLGTGSCYFHFDWDGEGWYVDLQIGAVHNKFYRNITNWYTYRILFNTEPIVEPPAVGSQQLHGWTTNVDNVGISNRGIQTNWYRSRIGRFKG